MKKTITLTAIALALFCGNASAQATIGATAAPNPTAVLDLQSTTRGFLPPRMSTLERDQINGGVFTYGIVIYNLDVNCLQYWNGTAWITTCDNTIANTPLATLNCGGATTTGPVALNGQDVSGLYVNLPYSGGNGGIYPSQTINSTGVTGLVAYLNSGILNNGNGNLFFIISGNPTSSGTASFPISLGGSSCSFNINVGIGSAVVTVNCAGASLINGPLTSGVAIGAGVTLSVPYTGGNGGFYPATTVTSGGKTGVLATTPAGNVAVGSGNLIYTLSGTPASGVSGNAIFNINIGGQSCQASVPVAAGGASVATIDCSSAVFTPSSVTSETAYTGSFTIPYTGGNGVPYPSGNAIASTGVTGLTATLAAGTLASGSGTITYNVTGTPNSGGTANFAITFGGQSCSVTKTVNLLPLTCNAIKLANSGAASGIYTIDPDANGTSYGATQVYCDMTTDGGGWTLIAVNGTTSYSSTSTSSVTNQSVGGWLPRPLVQTIANNSTTVQLRSGASAASYANKVTSNNTLAISALRSSDATASGAGTWHNGAGGGGFTVNAGTWCWLTSGGGSANGWPTMYHSVNNASCVHWFMNNTYNRIFNVGGAAGDPWASTWVK